MIIPVAALMCVPAFCDCSRGGGECALPDMSRLPDYVAGVAVSICDNDSAAFASMVRYPLARPYPLRDIADSAGMAAYYHVMVDDSLRSLAEESDTVWDEYGWRGWALGDGRVWVDEDGVYDVPYISAAEKKRYDELVAKEMATLTPAMRRGYVPVGCYRDDGSGAVYRIDRRGDSDTCRLAVYAGGARRGAVPDRVLAGRRVTEGSGAYERYEFAGRRTKAVLTPDPASDEDTPSLSLTDSRGTRDIAVTPVYWLDVVR